MEDDVRKIEGCPIYIARGVLCPRLKFLCLCSPSTTSTRVCGTHYHKDTTAEMCPNGPEWMTIWPFVHSCEDTMSGLTGACATSHTPRLCFQALMIPANFWQSPHCCITSLLRNMTKQTMDKPKTYQVQKRQKHPASVHLQVHLDPSQPQELQHPCICGWWCAVVPAKRNRFDWLDHTSLSWRRLSWATRTFKVWLRSRRCYVGHADPTQRTWQETLKNFWSLALGPTETKVAVLLKLAAGPNRVLTVQISSSSFPRKNMFHSFILFHLVCSFCESLRTTRACFAPHSRSL